MGLSQFCPDVRKTLSNFAAAKYGTISIFVMTLQNNLKICSWEIWDCFNFYPDIAKWFQISLLQNMGPFGHDTAKQSQILWLQNMGPFQFLSLSAQNGLKFCSWKIWDHFNFGHDMAKQSQNLQLRNLGPFQSLS